MPEWLTYYRPIKKAVTCGLGEDFVSGTGGVKGEAQGAISPPPTPSTALRAGSSQKTAKDGAPTVWFAIARLGHPPKLAHPPRSRPSAGILLGTLAAPLIESLYEPRSCLTNSFPLRIIQHLGWIRISRHLVVVAL